jgi:DNA-binding GntR family transcriptional regulator
MPIARFPNIYGTLKALDAPTSAAFIAAAAQAASWEPEAVARLCKLTAADPSEVDAIVRQARAASASGDPASQWLPYEGC